MAEAKRLYRSRTDRMIAGVCGGLADYFGIDLVLVRVVSVVAVIATGGLWFLGYILLWLFVPQESVND